MGQFPTRLSRFLTNPHVSPNSRMVCTLLGHLSKRLWRSSSTIYAVLFEESIIRCRMKGLRMVFVDDLCMLLSLDSREIQLCIMNLKILFVGLRFLSLDYHIFISKRWNQNSSFVVLRLFESSDKEVVHHLVHAPFHCFMIFGVVRHHVSFQYAII